MKLPQNFFERNVDIVAKELFRKVLIRKIGKKELRVRIVWRYFLKVAWCSEGIEG